VNRLRRNTFILIFSNVGGAALSFLLSALIGRSLGEEGLGIYAVVMAWIYPISLLVEFGIGTLMTRDLAAEPEHIHETLETATLARLILGGVALIALLVFAPVLSDDPRIIFGLQLSAPMVILLPLYSSFTAVFRAREAMLPIPFLNIGMLVTQVILTVFALALGWGVIGAFVANVVSSALQLIAAYGVYRQRFAVNFAVGTGHTLTFNLRPLLKRSWHFALAALFAALQLRLSSLLLESLATTSAVGYFIAASRFVEAARMFPNAFFGALFPTLSALSSDPVQLRRTFSRAMWMLGAFGVFAGVACTILASILIEAAFGAAFVPAVPVLQLLAWSLVFSLLRGGRTLYWYALGRESLVNFVNGAVIVLQVVLSLWLIPVYGAIGAALAQVVVEFAALMALWVLRPPIADNVLLPIASKSTDVAAN
jgi:PST family polysaccharide transporter